MGSQVCSCPPHLPNPLPDANTVCCHLPVSLPALTSSQDLFQPTCCQMHRSAGLLVGLLQYVWVMYSSFAKMHGSSKSSLAQRPQIKFITCTLSSQIAVWLAAKVAMDEPYWHQMKCNESSWVGLEPSVRCCSPAQLKSSRNIPQAKDSIHGMDPTLWGTCCTTNITTETLHCLA